MQCYRGNVYDSLCFMQATLRLFNLNYSKLYLDSVYTNACEIIIFCVATIYSTSLYNACFYVNMSQRFSCIFTQLRKKSIM